MKPIKRMAWILAFWCSAAAALAGDYSGSEIGQKAFVSMKGPAVFGVVAGNNLTQFVVGYKRTGVLAKVASKINVHLKVKVVKNREVSYIEKCFPIVKLEKNRGYLSPGMEFYSCLVYDFTGGEQSSVESVEIRYSVNDVFDPIEDTAYSFPLDELFHSDETATYESRLQKEYPSINADVWDFITALMGK